MFTQEWEDWLISTIHQPFVREQIMFELTKKGNFTYDVANEILNKIAIQQNRLDLIKKENVRPEINDTVNQLKINNKIIPIVMSYDMPRIVLFENVLSNKECEELIKLANKKLTPSIVVDWDSLEGKSIPHNARTSSGMYFRLNENTLISNIDNRLAKLVNWPVNKSEGIQILRYEIGQEYKPHNDWFDPTKTGSAAHLNTGGQRVGTIIMYLTDVNEGGATIFPKLGLQIKPKKGSALFFANVTDTGMVDIQTLHGGMPVISGTKFIATKWLREFERG
jgi:prolyl 4-hydroxylase